MKKFLFTAVIAGVVGFLSYNAIAQDHAKAQPKAADKHVEDPIIKIGKNTVPKSITTPNYVETRLGGLEFFDGVPTKESADALYENLDFMRGVEVFLNAIPGASLVAFRQGLREVGCVNGSVCIWEDLMDANALLLTPNTSSIYFTTWLDLRNGPMVVESPPNTLMLVDDFWFRYVADMGNVGPDKGKGGKYLYIPPEYEGEIPKGYYIFYSKTYGNWILGRGFQVDGSTKPAVENIKTNLKIYPLAKANKPSKNKFKNVSGKFFNTVHANDFHFYEEVDMLVQEEPADALDPERAGLLASIGIKKGKKFAPDERMKKILTEAAAVGNATARAFIFNTRYKEAYFHEGSAWKNPFVGGSYEFLNNGSRILDARTFFHYYATGITPAMAVKLIGKGSKYAMATVDSNKQPFDGSKTYKTVVPANVPAKKFWSFTLYDNQTRAMLPTEQHFPAVSSDSATPPVANEDGTYDIYFGPTAPKGKEYNWIQTIPNRGWSVIFRLYGPLEPWFEKTWKLNEVTPVTD